MHIASYQNATSSARVIRNARLLGEGWPATAPAFVYQTPEIGHPEPIVPFIDITRAIPIGVRYACTLANGVPPVSALLTRTRRARARPWRSG
ncbi:hypothetical protein ABIA35_002500 [Catenulispora sp. MAP12-49]|uniref:hypothetical protein n=1 Tax=Catenulispora sp. MAP12-49 TaxID=3156302 RepID=UPI0035135D36